MLSDLMYCSILQKRNTTLFSAIIILYYWKKDWKKHSKFLTYIVDNDD